MATPQPPTIAATGTLAPDDGPSCVRFFLLLNCVALVLVAIWLRFDLLGNLPGVNGDEAWYGVQAWEMFHGGAVEWHTPSGNPLNPLFVGPLALLHLCLPPSFVLLRSMAVASGLAALAINWLFCRWAFDRRTAAVSTVALAVLPINIAYSRFAWDASQSLAATLPVVYCALAAVKHADRFGRWMAAATLTLALAVWVHPTNLFAGVAIAAACLAQWRRARKSVSEIGRADIPAGRWNFLGRQECLPHRSLGRQERSLGRQERVPHRFLGRQERLRHRGAGLAMFALAMLILAAWIWAARPTHGLLAQHVAERLNGAQQLDRCNMPSSFVSFARLFTGGTVYRYLAGSRSWFEWPGLGGADAWGVDVAMFWACAVGAAWLVWRRRDCRAVDAALLDESAVARGALAVSVDRVLLGAWGLELVAFFVVAGPHAMVPGQERFSICLLATTVLVVSRGAVALWDLASRRWRIVLAVATLAVWPLLADFHANYFRFIERTGGQAHLTFRTAATEPKQAALQCVLDESKGTEPVWIIASQWWNRWPIRYLALGDPRICGVEANEREGSEACRRAVLDGRVWYVEFFNTPEYREVESRLSGRNAQCQTFPDYAGRPLLSVFHPNGR